VDDDQSRMETLRATSDQLIIAIAETDARERRKRGMAPSDPSFIELAQNVRTAAEVVLELARQEERVARSTSGAPDAVGLRPIEQVSPAKELAGILEQWRAVEQRLLAASPGSPDAEALMLEFELLRGRYSEALKARQRGSSGGSG
jgi:hypothetical protein